jgi:hypothetical protein
MACLTGHQQQHLCPCQRGQLIGLGRWGGEGDGQVSKTYLNLPQEVGKSNYSVISSAHSCGDLPFLMILVVGGNLSGYLKVSWEQKTTHDSP